MSRILFILIAFTLLPVLATGQLLDVKHESVIYKRIDSTRLWMDIFYPSDLDSSRTYPAMVFFFGGGWTSGTRRQFELQARYFATRGMVTFLPDYRVTSRHGSTIFDSMEDAKDAVASLSQEARKYFIDPNQIVVVGGSAGAQLALYTAFKHDPPLSHKPAALVVFNPPVNMGPTNPLLYRRVGPRYRESSPIHNIDKGMPPMLILHGTADKFVTLPMIENYLRYMDSAENEYKLVLYEGRDHGFFNPLTNVEDCRLTTREADEFLCEQGFISGPPTIMTMYIPLEE